jgi:flagellar hook-associated protein 1 FlgK
MYTSQRALDVTGHNVSNVDTVGYVRQQLIQSENRPATYTGYQIGTGVNIDEVRQIRSLFLDNSYRKENSTLNYWNTMQKTVEDIEGIMNEFSDNDLGNTIDEFFEGWEELAKDPESRACRESLVEYGNRLADTFNQISQQLDQIQENLNDQIIDMVDKINSVSEQVAQLNGLIRVNEVMGDNANDYRDQLKGLLETLSGYANIKVTEDSSGMFNVTIGGTTLVNGTTVNKMICKTNASNGAFATVLWEKTGSEVKLKDGELLGLIEARGDVNGDKGSSENGSPVESGYDKTDVDNDADAYNFTGDSGNLIPELRTALNMLVSLMTRKINAIHSNGVGLDGSTGTDFFVKIDEDLPFQAGNIMINPDLDDPNKIAVSATGASGDITIANEIISFKDMEYFQNYGLKMGIDDFYAFIVNWIGTGGDQAESAASNQSTLVQQIENKRTSLSAVSLDEEMTNMMKYQYAYNASVQVMNMIDGMLDKLINGTGVVGR